MLRSEIIIPLIAAFFTSIIITPLSLIAIRKLGLFDDPKRHKHPAIIHSKPVPRGGGIPLFLGIFLASIFIGLPLTPITISIFFAALLSLVVGVLDDKYDISPYIRFPINILCAAIVVSSGVSIPYITSPFGGILRLDNILILNTYTIHIGNIIAILWIVWVMNMLNWSKGVDGQMPGIVAISAIIIGLLSLRFPTAEQNTLIAAQLSFLISGASLGFLLFNFYPAKIFPGYGATAVYLLLAAVSILSSAKLATAILVMAVPMIDGLFTITRRILSGKSPFRHDNKHLHHILLRRGFTQRNIALFYWLFSAIVGVLSLYLESKGKLFALIMVAIIVGGALLFLHLAGEKRDEKEAH